ncbi:MAG: hypothetical protein Q7T18_08565 [Sedimentisphaerales bacterium]|nr:hypothetical protein [Sedimentisphaerales bacterium]
MKQPDMKVIDVNEQIKKQIIFALEDDNEVMSSIINSDLHEVDKQMSRQLIKQHKAIINKIEKGQHLTQEELQLVWDANTIHAYNAADYNEHYLAAVALNDWLDTMMKVPVRAIYPTRIAAREV